MHGRGVVPDLFAGRQVRDSAVESQPSTVLNRAHRSLQLLSELCRLASRASGASLAALRNSSSSLRVCATSSTLTRLGNMAWHCWIVNCVSSLTQETTQPALAP